MPFGMTILIQGASRDPNGRNMKMRYGILFLAVLVVLALAFMLSRRPSAKDFCFGTRSFKLLRIEFNGQGRRAILSDSASLVYLSSLAKLKALPVNIEITNGYAFDTKLFDRWGHIGTIQTVVSSDESTLSFACFESLLGDASFSFVTAESNAPIRLKEVIRFLLEDKNRGRIWTEAGVGPTN
jgi:hypothetical protein